MISNTCELKKNILQLISGSANKLTPQTIIQNFAKNKSFLISDIKSAIAELVSECELEYSSLYGRTFLELSFNKAIQISRKIIIAPYFMNPHKKPDQSVVKINRGASFGTGQHPTTKLAISGIEYTLSDLIVSNYCNKRTMLDIGTGSGILAIVSVILGINTAVGIDIDPCALKESKDNVRLNRLENKIQISNSSIETFIKQFSLITANLRYPTLLSICSHLDKLTESGSSVVLSGIKTYETARVIEVYSGNNFSHIWEKKEKDWSCIVFQKK